MENTTMDKLKVKHNVKNNFIVSEIYLRLIGVWPYQYWMSQLFFRYFWIIQHLSIMLPEGIKIIENIHDVQFVTEASAPFIYNIIVMIKYLNGILNKHKIKSTLDKINRDWENINDEKEKSILHEHAEIARMLNIAYLFIIYTVLLTFMLVPLRPIVQDFFNPLNESRQKNLLYMVEFFIDEDKYYYTILTHAYITSLAGIMPLFGSDTFLLNCVHHACGMLTILGHRMINILENKKGKPNKEEYKEVVHCVLQHRSILDFCEDLNELYSTSFFFLLSVCIVLMSITGVLTVFKIGEDFNDCVRFAMFTIAQIFHMYCYNFMGQNLINFGDKLNDNIYTSRWYAASSRTKYAVQFMLLRSQKSSKIKAKIFPLSLENFTAVLKTSMSYFTVLKSTR